MKTVFKRISMVMATAVSLVFASAAANAEVLPDPTSADFCQRAQQLLATTEIVSENNVFDNMPDYRSSKPSAEPGQSVKTYQVVTYKGDTPIVVSCKVKTSDHIQDVYGEDKAGQQNICALLTGMLKDQAVAELLSAGNPGAADIARNFAVEQTEPVVTGRSYLADFQPVTEAADGTITLHSPGLQVEWDSWWWYVLPDKFVGQTYCHLPTADLIKGVATGDMSPGLTVTTVDDAPTTPQG